MAKPSTTEAEALITEEDVKETLRADKGKDAVLKDWKVVNFTKQGDNYACFVTSVEVKYSEDNSDKEEKVVSYVVKLNPQRSLGIEDMTHEIFLKEGRFYQEIVPELNACLEVCGRDPLRLPRCFFTNTTPTKEQIYFEDLRARDFKMFDRRKGMDRSHATLVLQELARLHSASYLLQEKTPMEPVELKYDFLLKDWLTFTDNAKDVMLPMIQGYVTNSANMLKKVKYDEKVIAWVEGLVPKLEEILTTGIRSEKYGSVCHGDCWNNNILFRYNDNGDPIEVMLLDLQICRKASLASDLNYFLYTSLTGDVRTANMDSFMSTYHSAYEDVLCAGGKAMFFTEEELKMEFKDKNILGAVFGMAIIPILLLESDEVPNFDKSTDILKAVDEMKAKSMSMLDTNPILKPRFLSIFEEFMKSGLIS